MQITSRTKKRGRDSCRLSNGHSIYSRKLEKNMSEHMAPKKSFLSFILEQTYWHSNHRLFFILRSHRIPRFRVHIRTFWCIKELRTVLGIYIGDYLGRVFWFSITTPMKYPVSSHWGVVSLDKIEAMLSRKIRSSPCSLNNPVPLFLTIFEPIFLHHSSTWLSAF